MLMLYGSFYCITCTTIIGYDVNNMNYMDLKQQINSEINRWNKTKAQREEAFGYYVEDSGYAYALACHSGELIQLELICETLANLQETLTVIGDNLDAVNAHLTMLQDRCLMEILAPADKHGNDANRFVDRQKREGYKILYNLFSGWIE